MVIGTGLSIAKRCSHKAWNHMTTLLGGNPGSSQFLLLTDCHLGISKSSLSCLPPQPFLPSWLRSLVRRPQVIWISVALGRRPGMASRCLAIGETRSAADWPPSSSSSAAAGGRRWQSAGGCRPAECRMAKRTANHRWMLLYLVVISANGLPSPGILTTWQLGHCRGPNFRDWA